MLFTNKSTFWLLKSLLTFIILTVFMKEDGVDRCAISKFKYMIRINVTIEVKSEVRAQVVELLREMSELSRQEKGCIGYEILENNRLDNVLMIIETWENEDLLAVHKGREHFVRIIPRVRELATEMCSQKFTDMASVSEAIVGCRSVRNYTPDKVCLETIERLLRAAMYAPSVKDRRPWEFFVIEDREHLDTLAEALPEGLALKTAPVAILVCCNTRQAGLDGENWPQELGACVQNLMLQAYGEKLGTTWIEIYPRMHEVHQVKTLFHLSSEFVPFAVVAIGKPVDEQVVVPECYDPSKIHFITR
ncbi:hypothetical protein D8S85_02965 [Butyricimonas faecalis]|uniref:ABM domain-containing protein n=2 Tax=Butyricimonas faecalis TaxID=2093856 RepID=A0A3Q9ILH4_9BACT|nr:hypothetical protein D8S85_02965 [Butyricimonas faecalis]